MKEGIQIQPKEMVAANGSQRAKKQPYQTLIALDPIPSTEVSENLMITNNISN